ncbi:pAP2 family protein [Firmicutes bacterium CAG:460]|nr:pAP2 family protein [Firmicutes bacterium CAG:460]
MKKFSIFVVVLCLILFGIICYGVLSYDSLVIDTKVYSFIINNIMNDGLTPILKAITELGGVAFTVLAGVLIFMFCKKNRWFITIDLVGVTLVNQVIKHIIRRPRPNVLRLVEESGYSFPSGHSMVSMAFYGIIIYLVYKNVSNKYLKWILIILLSLLILSIGFSRIYVGVHYFTDVAGGFLLGLAYLIIYINIYNKRIGKNEE